MIRVDMSTISWITDYLTGIPRSVQLDSDQSEKVQSSTGVPQEAVLSFFPFSLHTTDFQYNSRSCKSSLITLQSDGKEEEYRALVDNFVEWSGGNILLLTVAKTSEGYTDPVYSGRGCWNGGGVQIPECPHPQQADGED